MRLLNKIIHLIFSWPKPKELSHRCEVFLYPETAEKLKEIQKLLEKEHNKNSYNNDYETQKAELFRKVVGISYEKRKKKTKFGYPHVLKGQFNCPFLFS